MSGALFEGVLFRKLREKNRLLAGMADRDGLTGLYNHMAIFKRLQETLDAAQRNIFPVTFLMIDIDELKKINDTFGHSAGGASTSSSSGIPRLPGSPRSFFSAAVFLGLVIYSLSEGPLVGFPAYRHSLE